VAGPDLATWATVVGTWVLIVGTLSFAYWQMRQTQRINSAQTILDLRNRFDAPPMRASRRELATQLLEEDGSKELGNFDVGLFFELVGSLTHERILDRRMIRSSFGTWVTGYYYLLTHPVDRVARWRTESRVPLIFAQFEWLVREVEKLDRSAVGPALGGDRSREEARDTLETESQLPGRG
jgi:hypothetical protein